MKGLGDAEDEGMEGSRPRRARWEGVSGMSVTWSRGWRVGRMEARSGRRAERVLARR